MEQELQRFWRLNVLGWRLFRANPLDPAIDEVRDELEVMAQMTEWPRVREASLRWLRIDDAIRLPLIRAGVA